MADRAAEQKRLDIEQQREIAEQDARRQDMELRKMAAMEKIEQLKVEAARLNEGRPAEIRQPCVKELSVLPKLNIPTFNGNPTYWLNFKDLFKALVVDNANLNASQKLQYLKNALRDQPLDLIANLPSTDANFQIAWDLLDERYNSPRDLVAAYIKRLFDLPIQKTESAEGLRKLSDATKEVMRSLEILQRKPTLGEDIVTYLISQKLHSETKKDFTLTFKDKQPPALDKLLEFLERRAEAFTTIGAKYTRNWAEQKPKPEVKRRKPEARGGYVAATVEKKGKKCSFCDKDGHLIYTCNKFTSQTFAQRKTWVIQNKRCLNCLSNFHLVKDCKSKYNCNTCKKKHNTLLHEDRNLMDDGHAQPAHFVPRSAGAQNAPLNPNSQSFQPLVTACSTSPKIVTQPRS